MIDFKSGWRLIGVISSKQTELVNVLIKNGFRLFINCADVYRIDVYAKEVSK